MLTPFWKKAGDQRGSGAHPGYTASKNRSLSRAPTALALRFLLTTGSFFGSCISAPCAEDQTFWVIEPDQVVPTSPFLHGRGAPLRYSEGPSSGLGLVGRSTETQLTEMLAGG